MAEGGEVVLHAGQEEVFDWNCSHCEASGIFVEAVVYCPQCEEAYCELCFQGHARFSALKSHKILSKDQQEEWGSTKSDVDEKCIIHDGQEFSMYCGKHDTVCCPVCASLDHGSCKELVYIPKVAEGIFKSTELQNTLAEINSTLSFTQKIKKKKQVLRGVIVDYKSGIVYNLEEEKRRIVESFDELIKRASDDVDAVYRSTDTKLLEDVKICGDAERTLVSTRKLIADNCGDKQGFLNLKSCQKKLGNLKKDLPVDLASIPESKQVLLNKEIGRITEEVASALANTSPIDMFGCKFELHASRRVAFDTENVIDTNGCEFIDICVLPNMILMSDSKNNNIKIFDMSYELYRVVEFDRSPSPRGLCSIGNDEVVVAMDNQSLMFFSSCDILKETKTVEVSHECYGVTHHASRLYVSDKSTTIYIYCTACMPLASVDMYVDYIRGPFVKAGLIKIGSDGEQLHVLDLSKGLVIVNKNGKHVLTRTPQEQKTIGGICLDTHGNIFMSMKFTHSVVQLELKDDMASHTIAGCMNDLDNPGAMAAHKSSLIVANNPITGPGFLVVLDIRVK